MKPKRVLKPWGSFTTFLQNKPCTVKILFVKKGEQLSLQYHFHREEHWVALDPGAVLHIGKRKIRAIPGKEYVVPQKALHRIAATQDARILEISIGTFDENDIVRLEDRYGRIPAKKKK